MQSINERLPDFNTLAGVSQASPECTYLLTVPARLETTVVVLNFNLRDAAQVRVRHEEHIFLRKRKST